MQWIAAWQTSDTTMNIIVKSTARGERVVSIKQPNSQKASVSAIGVKSVSVRVKGPILKVKLHTTGCVAELRSRNGNVMTWSQIWAKSISGE